MAKVVVENVYKSYSRVKADNSNLSESEARYETALSSTKTKSKQVNVLRDINFTVEDGEFLVLVGPSGCGKSTLLRLLAGLEELTGGNIKIGDRLVNDLPPKVRDIAMVFQNYALYPHLNIYDNLAFGLRRNPETGRLGDSETDRKDPVDPNLLEDILTAVTRHLPRSLRYVSTKEKLVRDRVRYVASLLQIESLLGRLPKELSGGQKQRVALGRAIARNPQVFLMDEPLSNLDAKLRTQTRAQIVKLQRQLDTTTIYVTHDQTEAMTMGDRIAVMNNGQIQQIAPPLEIYEQPANRFVAEFIGSPPMNFLSVALVLPVKLVHKCFELDLPETWAKPLQESQAKSLILGIRPQHLVLDSASKSSIQVTVDLVEALGSETFISAHLTADANNTMTVSLPPDKPVGVGDSLWLAVDINKIHLFTVDDGRAIFLNNS
ncbi:ABC transporter ATP-binding protein [Pleurocapsa sp. PCC 7319]|uniref:ABC transporter ATP-binding protein n=1 Tax=Pleurocapsa sp. PCC 7319 TaxID=118161 RepID=UPI000347C3AF|nr:ATP-binding cassette domain-containing protein [Pleurocapsa sp. PCC 7319]